MLNNNFLEHSKQSDVRMGVIWAVRGCVHWVQLPATVCASREALRTHIKFVTAQRQCMKSRSVSRCYGRAIRNEVTVRQAGSSENARLATALHALYPICIIDIMQGSIDGAAGNCHGGRAVQNADPGTVSVGRFAVISERVPPPPAGSTHHNFSRAGPLNVNVI